MLLQQEIHEQPDVVQRLLMEQQHNIQQIAQAIRNFNPTYIAIAARGTSDNAARYAQYLFGSHARLTVALSTPSLHTLYETPPDLSKALVIGVSQSGQAEDVRRVLADASAQGAMTLSITNYANSPMAQTSAHHIELLAGEERSIAATKTYTAQLTVFAMLCTALLNDGEMQAQLEQLSAHLRTTLDHTDHIQTWAERYRYMERFAVIGRGYNYSTAFEISLKVKELSYIPGEGYSEADFRHGPIALIAPGFPVITVAAQGKTLPTVVDLVRKLRDNGAETLIISNDDSALGLGTKAMRISEMPEWLSPVAAVIPGQVFAMQQAAVRGYEIDQPRGLTKVTVTE
jgi:glucosamine--fructose-6-phosphate aminotransferase (isomerizing)